MPKPVISNTKRCTIDTCKRTNVAFYPNRGQCAECYKRIGKEKRNAAKPIHVILKNREIAQIRVEISEIRIFCHELQDTNQKLRNENKELQKPQNLADVLASLRVEIIALQDENKELRKMLVLNIAKSEESLKETLQKDLRYELIAKIQAEIKELRELSQTTKSEGDASVKMQVEMDELRNAVCGLNDSNTLLREENFELCELLKKQEVDKNEILAKMQAEIKEVRESLHVQNGRIDDIGQMQNDIKIVAPPMNPFDITSDFGARCDSIEKSLEKLEKAQTELIVEQRQHAKYTKTGFETIRSQFGDDKIGNKVLAVKIDTLTTALAKIEDPDKTPKARKITALKKNIVQSEV